MNPNTPNNNQVDPQDTRNMIIFFVIAAVLYFGYDGLVLKPQRDAVALQQAQQRAQVQMVDPEEAIIEPLSREEALAETSGEGGRVTIENSGVSGSLLLTGGRLDDIALNEHFQTLSKEKKQPVLSPLGTDFGRYVDYGWVSQDIGLSLPNSEAPWRALGNGALTPETPVTMFWDNGQGLRFERVIEIDDEFLFTITQRVKNTSGKSVTIYPFGLIAQTGVPGDFQGRYLSHEGPMGYVGGELVELSYKKIKKNGGEVINADTGWAGISDKYWLTSFIPAQGQNAKYTFKYAGDSPDGHAEGKFQVDFVGAPVSIQPGQTIQNQSHVFVGTKEVIKLKAYGDQLGIKNFDLAVDFGWLWFLSKPFFYMLHFLGKLTGNMGVAIILLTLLIRSSVFPLTNKSYRSFAKMKKVSPRIAELRKEYGDDKAALQGKIMEMYQKEGVNPMAGCFPIVMQIPIFFALYKTLFVTIEIRHAPFFGWIKDLSAPDPTSVFNLFGLIPFDPPAFLMIGIWPCIMLVGMVIQRHLNPPPTDPIQRDMARYFPFIMAFILARFAAGLVIYWTFSAFIGLIQQMIIMRSMGVPIHLFGETKKDDEPEAETLDIIEETPAPKKTVKVTTPPKPKNTRPKKGKKKK